MCQVVFTTKQLCFLTSNTFSAFFKVSFVESCIFFCYFYTPGLPFCLMIQFEIYIFIAAENISFQPLIIIIIICLQSVFLTSLSSKFFPAKESLILSPICISLLGNKRVSKLWAFFYEARRQTLNKCYSAFLFWLIFSPFKKSFLS